MRSRRQRRISVGDDEKIRESLEVRTKERLSPEYKSPIYTTPSLGTKATLSLSVSLGLFVSLSRYVFMWLCVCMSGFTSCRLLAYLTFCLLAWKQHFLPYPWLLVL